MRTYGVLVSSAMLSAKCTSCKDFDFSHKLYYEMIGLIEPYVYDFLCVFDLYFIGFIFLAINFNKKI